MVDVVIEVMVEGCGFREGVGMGTDEGTTEEVGDFGGDWRDNFLVGMMELFKNSVLGLKTEKKTEIFFLKKVHAKNI